MNHVGSETHPDGVRSTAVDRLRIDDNGHGIWLGDKHIPWATVETRAGRTAAGNDYEHRVAIVRFENAMALRLDWGSASMSDNYDDDYQPFVEEPAAVECAVVAALDKTPYVRRLTWQYNGRTEAGWVPIRVVCWLLRVVADLPSDATALPAFGSDQ